MVSDYRWNKDDWKEFAKIALTISTVMGIFVAISFLVGAVTIPFGLSPLVVAAACTIGPGILGGAGVILDDKLEEAMRRDNERARLHQHENAAQSAAPAPSFEPDRPAPQQDRESAFVKRHKAAKFTPPDASGRTV